MGSRPLSENFSRCVSSCSKMKHGATYLVFVDVENLQAAETWVLFDHLVPDVHRLVVSVVHACLDVAQVQLGLPFGEPLTLRPPWYSGLLRCADRDAAKLFRSLSWANVVLRYQGLLWPAFYRFGFLWLVVFLISAFHLLEAFIIRVVVACVWVRNRLWRRSWLSWSWLLALYWRFWLSWCFNNLCCT